MGSGRVVAGLRALVDSDKVRLVLFGWGWWGGESGIFR
jgi:hypothetical protein